MVTSLECTAKDEDDDFLSVGSRISSGATIVFPTDTVYGLGSSPFSKVGIAKCFELKERDDKKPMPVLFSSVIDITRVAILDERAKILAKEYWPGPLTMVLRTQKQVELPEALWNSRRCIGVRIPNHECCLRLLRACNGALIGTSANISGRKPAVDCEEKDLVEFASKADYFVKGRSGGAPPSTVVDLSDESSMTFERIGSISKAQIISHLEEKANNADFSERSSSTF